jgi:DNA-binding NtrC family response regulator
MNNLRNKSILLIDDDAGMLRALQKVLSAEGASVTCAGSVAETGELLSAESKEMDLVITDLRMPYVSGLTVLYSLREGSPDLPVIILTAFGSPDVRAECLSQGAVAFLEKPLNTPQLLEAIEGVFASRKQRGSANN